MDDSTAVLLSVILSIVISVTVMTPMNSLASSTSNLSAAIFGQHQYIVYQNKTPPATTSNIFFKESHDGGNIFSPPKDLSGSTIINGTSVSGTLDSKNPKVGAFGNDVYVIWEGKVSGGNLNLFYTNSTDGGKNFINPIDVSQNRNVNVVQSTLIVDTGTGNVFVAYINDDGSVVPCHVRCD
jgi:hypothetical protein